MDTAQDIIMARWLDETPCLLSASPVDGRNDGNLLGGNCNFDLTVFDPPPGTISPHLLQISQPHDVQHSGQTLLHTPVPGDGDTNLSSATSSGPGMVGEEMQLDMGDANSHVFAKYQDVQLSPDTWSMMNSAAEDGLGEVLVRPPPSGPTETTSSYSDFAMFSPSSTDIPTYSNSLPAGSPLDLVVSTQMPWQLNPQNALTPPKRPRTKKDGTLLAREWRKTLKPEKCPFCNKGHQYKRDLWNHLCAKHPEQMPMARGTRPVCPDCQKSMSKKSNMPRHRKTCKGRKKLSG